MLRLSKKADYALMAMKHLATRPDTASASAREIAEQYDIPIELMAKVLQRLARRGLLTSHQGTRGGYRLGRPSSLISVADIIQAIERRAGEPDLQEAHLLACRVASHHAPAGSHEQLVAQADGQGRRALVHGGAQQVPGGGQPRVPVVVAGGAHRPAQHDQAVGLPRAR